MQCFYKSVSLFDIFGPLMIPLVWLFKYCSHCNTTNPNGVLHGILCLCQSSL